MSSVTTGNDVWIGAGVRILASVTIGDHVVIGVGAVVTRDIPSQSLAVGVPARPVKSVRKN
jgi:acetyltransferase-like isoleucine patch superfamily enzyme